MKSFSFALVFSSSSVNLHSYSYLTLKNRTDFNPTDCDRYLSTSHLSPTPLLCNDRNREALSVVSYQPDWSPDLHMTLTLGRFVTHFMVQPRDVSWPQSLASTWLHLPWYNVASIPLTCCTYSTLSLVLVHQLSEIDWDCVSAAT